eukprot:TRINITY_DN3641_c0_g1_i2.p1 TRINITY_DN3641_c0_g1~~TRINITY_DN3641_c0_g1_i2.p1  ORF type:complete len:395 (+),score=82.93 TRINITY_DN3641_c0_g1_i2:278-1462(+)
MEDPLATSHFMMESPVQSLPLQPHEAELQLEEGEEKFSLRFMKFHVEDMEEFIERLESQSPSILLGRKEIYVTGEGAKRFEIAAKDKIGFKIVVRNEAQSVIKGMNYLLMNSENEIFSALNGQLKFTPSSRILSPDGKSVKFPYLLVNVGSGVSIFKVNSETDFHRVSGSSIGGGTFFGLCKLLTKAKEYNQVLEITKKGDNNNCDLRVGDIYGTGGYDNLGLPADIIASCFGKVPRANPSSFSQEDTCRSAMFMVTVNIGQIVHLTAKVHGVDTIFFSGSFMRNNALVWERLSWAIDYWSGGTMEGFFLKHDGYLGALGAMLVAAEEDDAGATAGVHQRSGFYQTPCLSPKVVHSPSGSESECSAECEALEETIFSFENETSETVSQPHPSFK